MRRRNWPSAGGACARPEWWRALVPGLALGQAWGLALRTRLLQASGPLHRVSLGEPNGLELFFPLYIHGAGLRRSRKDGAASRSFIL